MSATTAKEINNNTRKRQTSTQHSFIHSISIAPLQVHYYTQTLPTQHLSEFQFYAKVPQATASEGLAQGPYVAARAGFEPATLRTKGDESTNEPRRPPTSP